MKKVKIMIVFTVLLGLSAFHGSSVGQAPPGLKITPILKTTSTFTGEPIVFPREKNQIMGILVEFAPGAQSGRHRHPLTQFIYVLEGSLTIEPEGHQPKTFNAGEGFVETQAWHNAVNRGTVPTKIFTVNIMEEGVPPTIWSQ